MKTTNLSATGKKRFEILDTYIMFLHKFVSLRLTKAKVDSNFTTLCSPFILYLADRGTLIASPKNNLKKD